MEVVGYKLLVSFDGIHNSQIYIGNGLFLDRPDSWEHKEGTETEHKQINHNENKIEVNPQLATVIVPGPHPFFKRGDKIFTHYLAYEHAEFFELDEQDVALIDDDLVMFKIVDGKYLMPDSFYLGEQIMEEGMTLDCGLTLDFSEQKKALTVKITHVPENASKIKLNDIVKTIDDYNYQFHFEDKNYIFLKEEEIVAKMI